MKKKIEISISPEDNSNEKKRNEIFRRICGLRKDTEFTVILLKRSIDARSRNPVINISAEIYTDEAPDPEPVISDKYKNVSDKLSVIIVGAGPAGYFAALELIENGIKPVIFDRGKDVRSRRKDLRLIQQDGIVNPDSNYCFGEGGAGTYSDGKLYTRSHKRGDIYKALKILTEHGADPDILYDAHPHIGSNKLPVLVQNLRSTILNYGGEVNFNSSVTDLIIRNNKMSGVVINNSHEILSGNVVLATGHSARDIYYLLKDKNILTEVKPFALGVRAEHPQELIDEIQYRQNPRSRYLPAASYKLAAQCGGRGVYSFCMCPGGLIVPAATSPGELVVNGMSMSRRDSKFANSGIVVAIETEDLKDHVSHGTFMGIEFQKKTEKNFFDKGDGGQQAPAQRLTDFLEKKPSGSLPECSYIPGIYSADINELLPGSISEKLRAAFSEFGKKMKGYLTEEAIITGPESRTSSPVRIPRDRQTYEHVEINGLYPCGEGAGYAGGIISAALDGQNSAKAIAVKLGKTNS
ncbi:MAG: FAD-dependent oxidoreductase [Ignavibacteria bacterium]|nr:FAD-dependent oxidoreductase [Ignavibacteria bacterium]